MAEVDITIKLKAEREDIDDSNEVNQQDGNTEELLRQFFEDQIKHGPLGGRFGITEVTDVTVGL